MFRRGSRPLLGPLIKLMFSHFEAWGGTVPASDAEVASYISAHAAIHAVATLTRRLAAISGAHEARGWQARRGRYWFARRCVASAANTASRKKQARPLLREDLFAVLGAMSSSPKDIRDARCF